MRKFCSDLEIERKIDSLLRKMTVEEKAGQLNQVGPSPVGGFEISLEEKQKMLAEGKITEEEFDRFLSEEKWDEQEDDIRTGRVGSFLGVRDARRRNHLQKIAVEQSRLGIPLLFGMDVIHGHRTMFPIPLAESCSWDETLFERTAQAAAVEAAADGIHWTFAPMLDIARDARWGRIAEGAGEDPYLASRYAAAKVRGFQGDDLTDPARILACAKHFIAYGAAIGGRDYNSADISLQTLWEVYMPPFIAACESGVATYMAAFNDLNGIPCSVNSYLLQDVLRDKLGFEGLVVSDAGSIWECIAHGVVADRKDAGKQALIAGIAIDMVSRCYLDFVPDMVLSGEIPEERLDEAVRQVLRLKYAKGLFDQPYTDETLEEKVTLCPEHRALARDAARKSMVLLKNNGILPMKKDCKIAVVGELSDIGSEMLGTWTLYGKGEETVTFIDALKTRNISFVYAPCCGVETPLDRQALQAVIIDADVVIAMVGELRDMSGEASSLSYIGLAGDQDEMLRLIKESNKPLVTVLVNGRPMAVGNAVSYSDAVLEAWHGGTETGNAIVDILFGDYNPSARLTTTFPNASGECPIYYNHVSTGRPTSDVRHSCKYIDSPLKPLYPFGYGLSYTTYTYNNLEVKALEDTLEVIVEVMNDGNMAGEETVQLYVQDVLASRARPVRELKGFKKIYLQPGELQKVSLSVPVNSLGFYNDSMEYIVEPGEFKIYVGHDSEAELCQSVVL